MRNTVVKIIVKVHHVRVLTPSTYIIRMDRNALEFMAGQYIRLGFAGDNEKREYSIYSGEQDPFLEVLIREVEDGLLSRNLRLCKPGRKLEIEGPYGFFKLSEIDRASRKLFFIASGTGIAPFHSFVRSYDDMDYTIIHGIRYGDEAYDHETYPARRYISCTTKDNGGTFHGRITKYLEAHKLSKESIYLLCGNSNMIHDAMDILTGHGVPLDHIRAEVYF